MARDNKAIQRIVTRTINGNLDRKQAAELLKVSVRTIHNYERKFVEDGPDGLLDHRAGHYRKINPEEEMKIVACKLDCPDRSARWIRDRLNLNVSVETVRQVLLKYHLNHMSIQSRSRSSTSSYRWGPF
jgi:transposase